MNATSFPRLRIRADQLIPEGSFAETQAAFMEPDRASVAAIDQALAGDRAGIVAHYYMDPELQGVLTAAKAPHIHISDSLLMADHAVAMAEAGVKAIVVLGVDFMSENVRAVLNAAGFSHVPVLRLSKDPIGCSLAESAEVESYDRFLTEASGQERPLHVVYINTSLTTKARAEALVPTITCTSSNVVRTLLQAAAQIPDVRLWYGPDTYMGRNLASLLQSLVEIGDEAIQRLHPAHDRGSLEALLERYHHYQQGICVVHHMFGAEVAEAVREHHGDAYVAAHLEVPGPMFELALRKQQQGRGVVGSTSDILRFIVETSKRQRAGETPAFVLGTEAGMVTSIVNALQATLRDHAPNAEASILFPVASEAVTAGEDPSLPVIPGVAGGEGCAIEGGCATCPYMKMNSLDALLDVLSHLERPTHLAGFAPNAPEAVLEAGSVTELGTRPIAAMRHFQSHGELPDRLVRAVLEHRIG